MPESNRPFTRQGPFTASEPPARLRPVFPAGGPFQNSLSELSELVRSLGGHIFDPDRYNFADSSTLNAVPSIFDSAVGYAGDVTTQALPENFVTNSMMVGGGVGVAPADWDINNVILSASVSVTISETGVDSDGAYSELTFSGTTIGAGASSFIQFIGTPAYGKLPVATPGQLWSGKIKTKLISGTPRLLRLAVYESTTSTLGSSSNTEFTCSATATTFTQTRRFSDATATRASLVLQAKALASGEVWNQVIRIYAPQLERGRPTNFTPTYGTAISRGVFAAAAQDTTNSKPILKNISGKPFWQFDGVDDHLITGITTPSSGYMLSVFRQDETLGGYNTLIGAGNTVEGGGGFSLRVRNTGNMQAAKYDNAGTIVAIDTAQPITVGQLMIADASWTVADYSVRLNGVGTSASTTRDPVGTGIMLIGARNTEKDGAVTPNNLMQGMFGIQIIIPQTIPAATEARIRQLVGQIYRIQTL